MAVVKVASVARAAWLEVSWEVMMARVERAEAEAVTASMAVAVAVIMVVGWLVAAAQRATARAVA